jgi:hypothetical protein
VDKVVGNVEVDINIGISEDASASPSVDDMLNASSLLTSNVDVSLYDELDAVSTEVTSVVVVVS